MTLCKYTKRSLFFSVFMLLLFLSATLVDMYIPNHVQDRISYNPIVKTLTFNHYHSSILHENIFFGGILFYWPAFISIIKSFVIPKKKSGECYLNSVCIFVDIGLVGMLTTR